MTGATELEQAHRYLDHLVDHLEYALRTTYPDLVLRNGECEVCAEVVALAETAREDRLLYRTADWSALVRDVRWLPPTRPRDRWRYWQLSMLLERPAVRVIDEDGEPVETRPGRTDRAVLVVAHLDRDWRLLQWELVDRGSESA